MKNSTEHKTERLGYARKLLIVWTAIFLLLFIGVGAGLPDLFLLVIPFTFVTLVGNLHIMAKLSGIRCHQCEEEVYLFSNNFMAIITGRCPHCRTTLS